MPRPERERIKGAQAIHASANASTKKVTSGLLHAKSAIVFQMLQDRFHSG
jgi:hypothetical protein